MAKFVCIIGQIETGRCNEFTARHVHRIIAAVDPAIRAACCRVCPEAATARVLTRRASLGRSFQSLLNVQLAVTGRIGFNATSKRWVNGMVASSDRAGARQRVGSEGAFLGATGFLPERLISAQQDHPRFQEAVCIAIEGLIRIYQCNDKLNRVMNDRGRVIGGMIALYLHFSPGTGSRNAGLTIGRFQAFCQDMGICSPGRAWALLTLLRLEGYLALEQGVPDRRQRRLAPTTHLIQTHWERWAVLFEAISLTMPEAQVPLEVRDRLQFMAAFVRHLGANYLAGFRLLDHAPDLARVVESKAGLLVISSLFLSAAGGPQASGTVVPISISALSGQFGIARAHARKLIADAAETGLVERTDGSDTMTVLPRLLHAVSSFYAALFALLGHCAQAADEEIRKRPLNAMSHSGGITGDAEAIDA